jgi:hypothetical protein
MTAIIRYNTTTSLFRVLRNAKNTTTCDVFYGDEGPSIDNACTVIFHHMKRNPYADYIP